MAFRIKNLTALASGNGFTLWHYVSTEDVVADMDTANYFVNTTNGVVNLNAVNMLRTGDMIIAKGSGAGLALLEVNAVTTTPGSEAIDCGNLTAVGATDTD